MDRSPGGIGVDWSTGGVNADCPAPNVALDLSVWMGTDATVVGDGVIVP